MTEGERIADQMERAYHGDAWHGSPLMELLLMVSPPEAHRRPLPNAHTIAELTAHIAFWKEIVTRRAQGKSPRLRKGADWQPVARGVTAWQSVIKRLDTAHRELVLLTRGLDDQRLQVKVIGKPYNLYVMLHGVVQHDLYHAGQIAMLAKAIRGPS